MSLKPGACMVYRCSHPESVELDIAALLVCRCHAEELGEVDDDDEERGALCRVDLDKIEGLGWRLVMRLAHPDVAVLYPPGVEGIPS